MSKNYDLYPDYERKIDNWRRRILGYEKMKRDLQRQIQILRNQNKKQKEVIDKAKSLNHEISHIIYEDFLEENIIGSKFLYERLKKQLSILEDKEVSE